MAMHSTDVKGLIIIIAVIALLAAFVWAILAWQERNTDVADSSGNKYETVCVEGVSYLIAKRGYSGYMSVKFNRDGNVVLCDG